MHKEEEEKEYCVNYLICPSFSIYSSDKLSNIVDQLKTDHDNDTFEFVSFPKQASHQVFFHDVDDAGTRGSTMEMTKLKLLISDDNHRSDSLSSTKVDELDTIPADTYCLWTKKSNSSNRWKKSNSTGSSTKIWNLLDLLRRTKSKGKNTFNFLKKKGEAKSENSKHRIIENKRRTYLPYKQGIMKKKKKNDMMMEENNNTPRLLRTKDGPTNIPTTTTIVSAATTTPQRSNNKSRFAATATVDDGGGIDCSGKYFKSCMAGLIADCVALCCCPCAVLHCFALAFVKAPWVVGRRCLGLGKKKNKDRKVKRKCCKKGYDYDYDYEDDNEDANNNVDIVLERNRQMNSMVDTNVVGEMDNVTVNAAFEAEKVWLELYQIGHLDFGRVSSSHD